MTSLLAHAVGERGGVIAFEPHPDVVRAARRNVAEWRASPTPVPIELHELGLPDGVGEATLATDVFETNRGSASLEPPQRKRERPNPASGKVVAAGSKVGVMKINCEGHELHALRGARAMLSSGHIREIVFEEHQPDPNTVTRFFESYGYTVVQLGGRLRGPVLGPLGGPVGSKDDPSLLATRAPGRAVERLRVRGWAVYGVGPAGRVERGRRAVGAR